MNKLSNSVLDRIMENAGGPVMHSAIKHMGLGALGGGAAGYALGDSGNTYGRPRAALQGAAIGALLGTIPAGIGLSTYIDNLENAFIYDKAFSSLAQRGGEVARQAGKPILRVVK